MKVCSLFCGIGGIDLAFKRAGFNTIWANDNDKYACETYRLNFPETNLVEANIEDIDKRIIPDFDILVAGFPCQPFSVCGNKKGFSDKRGNAFFEICKVSDIKNPSIIFLENVANLTEHDSGKTFNIIHNELACRGYYLRYIIADACDYGNIPQHRTRTYIIAFKSNNQCDKFAFPESIDLQNRIFDIIDISEKAQSEYYFPIESSKYKQADKAITDNRQIYRFADYGIQQSKNEIAFTLKANMGTYPDRIPFLKDSFGIRDITPEECLLLQGFPSCFSFPDNIPKKEKYKQAGNTICVPVVERIVREIVKIAE